MNILLLVSLKRIPSKPDTNRQIKSGRSRTPPLPNLRMKSSKNPILEWRKSDVAIAALLLIL